MAQPETYPTRPVVSLLGTYPAEPGPALHLLAGVWSASCPSCGYQLATARTQDGVAARLLGACGQGSCDPDTGEAKRQAI
jgi:hypothetical protein